MLDSDLSRIYQCKNGTKSINLAVKRNIERFPDDFHFQLKNEEYENLRFQIETANYNEKSRTLPYVFTQEGVAMLSSVLRTSVAARVNVDIMRAFVIMRKYINEDLIEQKFYKEMLIRHDNDIKLLQKSFNELNKKEIKSEIYFNGQIYDSYSKILDIFSKAKEELIIIDSYVDKVVLDIIRRLKVNVIIITSKKCKLNNLDIERYNMQYDNLKLLYDDTFLDRYFILDKKTIYNCGTPLNYIGYKTFCINKLEDNIVIKSLMNKIINIISGIN